MKEEYLKALELDQKGDWDGAHETIQKYDTPEACWIHAYLHRKEGDLGNAGYWYSRAGRKKSKVNLKEEWQMIFDHVSVLS